MRFTFHNEHNRPFLTDGSADWLWPAAERAGIPLMVLMPSALDILDRIAAAHPGLKLVIDHVGSTGARPNFWDDPARHLRAGQAPERRAQGLGDAVAVD